MFRQHPSSDGIKRHLLHIGMITAVFVLAVILCIRWVDAAEIVTHKPSEFISVIWWVIFGFFAVCGLVWWSNHRDNIRIGEMSKQQDAEAALRRRRMNVAPPQKKSRHVPPVQVPYHSVTQQEIEEDTVVHRSSSNSRSA